MSKNLSFDSETNILTITPSERVDYFIGSKAVTGEVQLTKNTTVKIKAKRGYKLTKNTPPSVLFEVSKLEEADVDSNTPVDQDGDSLSSGDTNDLNWNLS